MMKKEHIVYLLFPLIYLFYFIGMKGHIVFWYGADWFLANGDYFRHFFLKPGGWSEYLGNFLLQFYKWRWAGAAILTLVPLGVFVSMRKIAGKLAIPGNWLLPAVIPSLLVAVVQCYMGVGLGEASRILFFYLSLWGYMAISNQKARGVAFTLLFPFFYLLLSSGGCIFLYASFFIYELFYSKGRVRYGFGVLWAFLLIVYPFLWKRWMWIMPSEDLYLLSRISGREVVNMLWLLYGAGLLSTGLAYFARKITKKGKRLFYLCELAVIVAACVLGVKYGYQKNTEYFLRMDRAAECGDWEEVLEVAESLEQWSREEFFYVSLALANRGELGEKLFNYPVWGIGCLYLPRSLDYHISVVGSEFYYRLKIPNEALHWTLQAAIASPVGINFRTLKRLIDVNIQKGDNRLADKYLAILEHSTVHGEWVGNRRAQMQAPQTERVLPNEYIDFFIGGRPFLSDMARVLDAGRSPEMTLDYILCGLLLNKDVSKFCQLFSHFYRKADGRKIPKAYEEAILTALAMGNPDLSETMVSVERRKAFADYNALLRHAGKNKKEAAEIMKGFKDTWWYYCHFVETKDMDVKGNLLEYQSH